MRICRFFHFCFALFSHVFRFIFAFVLLLFFAFFLVPLLHLWELLPVSNICCTLLGKKQTNAKIRRKNAKIKRYKSEKHRQLPTATLFCCFVCFLLFFAYYCALFSLCYLLLFGFCFVFAWFLHFHVLLFCFSVFSQNKLFDGWPCMAAIAQHSNIISEKWLCFIHWKVMILKKQNSFISLSPLTNSCLLVVFKM